VNERVSGNKTKDFLLKYIVYIVIAVACVIFAILNPTFVKLENLRNILTQSCTMWLVAIGMTLCLLTRGVDLSVGSTMYITAVCAWLLMHNIPGFPVGVAVLVALGAGLVIGLFNGFVVAVLRVYALLPTMATMYALRGLGLSIAGQTVCQFPNTWLVLVSTKFLEIPVFVWITLLLLIIAQLFLSRTRLGRHIFATGDNEKMAVEKNIKVFNVKVFVYAISGITAALAGILSSGQSLSSSFNLGNGFEFRVVTACVLGGVSLNGGRGTILPGVFVGGLILTFISNALVLMKANTYSYDIVYAMVIFFVVLLDTIRIRREEK
jgi:ribose transport system permease protein